MVILLSKRMTSQDLCQRCKIKSMKVNTGVPQGSKLSNFYIADMPRPTEPVKQVCYADDQIVWATGVISTAGPMPKYIRNLSRHISISQQAQRLRGIGRYILGTTEGNTTDDLQGSWEINHQLCCTCLEYKPT